MIDMNALSYGWLLFLAVVNFLLCSLIGWSAFCRMRRMSKETTKLVWRLRYVVLQVAASASGLGPWLWREWPGPGQVAMALAALFVVGLTAKGWRSGPPDYASRPAPLDEASHVHIAGGKQP